MDDQEGSWLGWLPLSHMVRVTVAYTWGLCVCIVHVSCINLYKICTQNRLTFKLVKILEHLSELQNFSLSKYLAR